MSDELNIELHTKVAVLEATLMQSSIMFNQIDKKMEKLFDIAETHSKEFREDLEKQTNHFDLKVKELNLDITSRIKLTEEKLEKHDKILQEIKNKESMFLGGWKVVIVIGTGLGLGLPFLFKFLGKFIP